MITFPIAKINLGLNVVEKRLDGYHNLQTVFYPVPIMDALEVVPMSDGFPSAVDCDLKITNINIEGAEFVSADLTSSSFADAHLTEVKFDGCDLTSVDL